MQRISVALLSVMLLLAGTLNAQERKTRDELVRDDLKNVLNDGFWIYNDLPKARAEAARTGKPMLVIFRCIPCEACAQLDRNIMERDPLIQSLMTQYVCLRIVYANGMDLALFQFDYDQSFAAFVMNADNTIYGRFGTRSHQTESSDDVSLKGFAQALQAGLALHRQYPQNKAALAGKQPQRQPAFASPNLYPQLREKYGPELRYDDKVAQSCIHCHQVGELMREYPRDEDQPISEQILFPYPHPKAQGLILDPQEIATVKRVEAGSVAQRDGFQAGDSLLSINDQPLISIADIQWVLDNAPAEGTLDVRLSRNGQEQRLKWTLDPGWRRRDDISWRATSWALRRMVTGGLLLETLTDQQRAQAGVADDAMALTVKHLGQYGPHALAKQAGFQQGDTIIAVDGHNDLMRETDLLAYLIQSRKIGDKVPFVVLRDGQRRELGLRMQR